MVWIVILTFFLFKTRTHYNKLVKKTGKHNLEDILEKLIQDDEKMGRDLQLVRKDLEGIQYEQKFHFKKIGFLRFNAFERISGDQSFIISLLNGEDSGIILNFLYTRDGLRVYTKRITKGSSGDLELSPEEKNVIQKAK